MVEPHLGKGQVIEMEKTVAVAKDELRPFKKSLEEAESAESDTRIPFCSACFCQDFQNALRDYTFRKSNGEPVQAPIVPDWRGYYGEDKFVKGRPVERRWPRDKVITVEINYQCKRNPKHHRCVMDSKPMVEYVERDKK